MHCAGPQAVGGPAEELPVVALLDAAQPQPGHEHRVRHLRVLLANIQYVVILSHVTEFHMHNSDVNDVGSYMRVCVCMCVGVRVL